jgi:hypothetical protein
MILQHQDLMMHLIAKPLAFDGDIDLIHQLINYF